MPKGDELLVVENLRAYYPSFKGLVRAVDDVSLEIREGESVGLLGESGCGKSSLALSIMGLFERVARFQAGASNDPTLLKQFKTSRDTPIHDRPGVHGKVTFRGKELTSMEEVDLVELRGKEISLIPQGLTHALNPQQSIGHQTAEPIDTHEENVRLINMKRRVLEYLGLVRLADAGIRYVLDPASFSGGESQRVLIAMALIAGPYLVIADEPTSALDVTLQRQIMDILRMVKEKFDVSTLLISHDAGVIAELSDRVAVMYAGKIQEFGDAIQVFHHPSHPYTTGLMASFPTIAMMQMKAGGKRPRLRGIRGSPPDPTDLPSGCTFHPRCVYCIEIRKTAIPEYREVEPKHYVRGHRWGEIEKE
ncbi:MAG: ABC transporter ATP-binding protein [Candidatus Thorarchaeota archaeon]